MNRVPLNPVLLTILCSLCWSTSDAATIVNGGFEDGTDLDAANWAEVIANPGAGSGTQVLRLNADPHAGTFHMTLEVNSAAAPGEVFLVSDLFPVTPGEMNNITFWSKLDANNGPGLVAFYTIQYLDSDGSNGGGVKGQTGPISFYQTLTSVYGQISGTTTAPTADTGVDAAFIRIQLAGGAFEASDGRIFVDDVFIGIPEPAAVTGMLLGGIALAMRRRRRRSPLVALT